MPPTTLPHSSVLDEFDPLNSSSPSVSQDGSAKPALASRQDDWRAFRSLPQQHVSATVNASASSTGMIPFGWGSSNDVPEPYTQSPSNSEQTRRQSPFRGSGLSQPYAHFSQDEWDPRPSISTSLEPDPSKTSRRSSALSEAVNDEFGPWHSSEPGPSQIEPSRLSVSPSGSPDSGAGWIKAGVADEGPGAISLEGVPPGSSKILEDDIAEGIRRFVPPRLQFTASWTLLYSLAQHGTSLNTLYSRVASGMKRARLDAGCILVVRDELGTIFGAFANEAIHKAEGYYGSGQCFLWKATPFSKGDFRVGSSVKAYPWTGRNNYMILSTSEFVSFGGGDGKFGLWLDSTFERGFSTRCPAFDNEVLSGKPERSPSGVEEGKFEVLDVEVWRVGS